jgi:tetratricopeptide (TPR) repeat protein
MKNPSKASRSRMPVRCLLALGGLMAAANALSQDSAANCGELRMGSDYRTSSKQALQLVESYHFTPEVEALIRGKSSMDIATDLSYTLVAFPNHHRALMSMMLFGQKLKTPQPPKAQFSVECFFQRALRFRSDDTTVRMIYASFLSSQSRAAEASHELAQVSKAAGNNALTYYNLGQIYFDLKDYARALENAHKAYGLGLTLSGLRDRLTRAGQWRDADLATSLPALGSTTGTRAP